MKQWHADTRDHRGYGYTRRQARQIRTALLDVMRAQAAELEAHMLAIVRDEQQQ